MKHKSLTAYGICDDCIEAMEPVCFEIGNNDLVFLDGRLLCRQCFDDGPYRKYDEEKDEYKPEWDELAQPTFENVEVVCGDKTYRLVEVK